MAWFAVRVDGESMRPTLRPGDLLAVRPARSGEPGPGQVVVARDREREVVKRVAAVDGDSFVIAGDGAGSSDSIVSREAIVGVVRARYWPPWRAKLFRGS